MHVSPKASLLFVTSQARCGVAANSMVWQAQTRKESQEDAEGCAGPAIQCSQPKSSTQRGQSTAEHMSEKQKGGAYEKYGP